MKIISTIKQWHKENRQYDGFFEFEFFSCLTMFLFAGNICIHNTTAVDWLIWVIWLQSTLFQAYKWRRNRSQKEILDFVKDRSKEMIGELIEEKYTERNRLVAANRRRQSAERKLKKLRKLVAEQDAKRKVLCKRLYDYEAALLDAYLGYVGLYGKPCEDNRQRIMEYLRNNGPKLFQIVMTRQMVEDAYENLMFPDVPKTDADNFRCYDGFWSKLHAAEDDREP